MKKAVLFLAALTLSVSLSAQSLADLARKEKARRESYGGRLAVVIRNVDLMRVQKVPAVEIGYPEGESSEDFEVPASEPAVVEESAPGPRAGANIALEAQLGAARDLVDLLTTKINALRQQYEYQDAMVPGYVIQEQLVETEKRLLKAKSQLARIEAQAKK